MIVADTSLSTRCGINGTPIAKGIARAVATLGLAGAFFQDLVGLITFDRHARAMVVRPRIGKGHAIHCVDAYQDSTLGPAAPNGGAQDASFAGQLRKTSLVPVVSDFLLEDPHPLLSELADLNAFHDVFLVMIDSAFAFELPSLSAGWIEGYDVETGQSRIMSAAELKALSRQVKAWQDRVARAAEELGLDVLRLCVDGARFHDTLVEFLIERRLRKR